MDTTALPVAPVHLEALPLGQSAATPWGFSPAWFLLIALGVPALVWLGCAWKRALDEDPHRLRRRGRRELQRLLKQVGRHGAAPAAAQLHAWMRATARTWGVALSTPTPVQICEAVRRHSADAGEHSRWRELWHSTEHGLFAAEGRPAPDWLHHASSAADAVRIPRRERWLPNRRRHWLPMLGLLAALALGGTPQDSAAQTTAQATLGGEVTLPEAADLGPAREQAGQALKLGWNDWAAHHNIAAADLQKQQWNAAVAHGTIAFLQHPRSAATRDNLRFALAQAQNPEPTLRRLLSGQWYERFATLFSPAQWQRLALAASLLLAAALTLAVLGMYRPQRRPLALALRGSVAAGVLLLVVSLHGWNSYGRLGDPRAGILVLQAEISPEPSDLTPREDSSPAAAGTIVQARRGFLGWQQVQVRDDLTGWVRHDAMLPFYAAAD